MRLSIGVMLSQMHSGSGLWQRGQSGTASAVAGPVSGSDGLDMRPLYACRRRASTAPGRPLRYSAGAATAAGSDRRRTRSIKR